MNALGEKIKELREQRGIKQVELARMVNVKAARISHWERGRRKVSFPAATRLASALGVTVEDLAPSALESEFEPEAAL